MPITPHDLSLRDWFAGMALDAIISKTPRERVGSGTPEGVEKAVARGAYVYADAMLAVRGEGRSA